MAHNENSKYTGSKGEFAKKVADLHSKYVSEKNPKGNPTNYIDLKAIYNNIDMEQPKFINRYAKDYVKPDDSEEDETEAVEDVMNDSDSDNNFSFKVKKKVKKEESDDESDDDDFEPTIVKKKIKKKVKRIIAIPKASNFPIGREMKLNGITYVVVSTDSGVHKWIDSSKLHKLKKKKK